MIPSSSKARPIAVEDLVDALAAQPRGACTYIKPETAEILTLTDDDLVFIEETDGQRESAGAAVRARQERLLEIVESEDWLQLPDRFEIHDWAIMESFVATLEAPDLQEHLLEVLHGPGALRIFPQVMEHLGLFDAWNRHHRKAMTSIAREWLEEHGLSSDE
jgi:hypothetical protein